MARKTIDFQPRCQKGSNVSKLLDAIRAYPVGDHLCVHRRLDPNGRLSPDRWTVSHVHTGYVIVPDILYCGTAIKMGTRLATHDGWTKKTAKGIMRAITGPTRALASCTFRCPSIRDARPGIVDALIDGSK